MFPIFESTGDICHTLASRSMTFLELGDSLATPETDDVLFSFKVPVTLVLCCENCAVKPIPSFDIFFSKMLLCCTDCVYSGSDRCYN